MTTGSCVCAPGSYNIPESKYCHYPMEAYYSTTTTEITTDQQKKNESVTEVGTFTVKPPTADQDQEQLSILVDTKHGSSACGSMNPSCPGNLICDLSNQQCVCPIGKHLIEETFCSGVVDESGIHYFINIRFQFNILIFMKARRSRQLYPSASKCRSNSDCTDGSFCNMLTMSSFCQCLSNYVAVKNRCLKAIYPGQFGCVNDLQCSAVHKGTVCHDNTCSCPPGTHLIFLVCVPENVIDNIIAYNVMIQLLAHSQLTISLDDRQRSSYANPGDRCDQQQQCLGGSFCFGRKCVCPDNSIMKHGRCDVDHQYENNYQIIAATPTTAPNPIIKKMSENTKLNFEDRTTIVPDNMLEKEVQPGHLCDSKINCAENALCVNGICRCFSNFELRSGRCVRVGHNHWRPISNNQLYNVDQ
uniref:EGF-like domain-containing protein n=1 Tax=Romanomermis culicivorax TaxID=13658 RepID=A0A915HRI3_ROMCU